MSLHDTISQKDIIFILAAVRTLNLKQPWHCQGNNRICEVHHQGYTLFSIPLTERRGLVVNNTTSYSAGDGFKSWPGDRLYCVWCFVIFLSPSRHAGIVPWIRPRPLPYTSFQISHTPITLPFDASEKVSLSKQLNHLSVTSSFFLNFFQHFVIKHCISVRIWTVICFSL
jgi:hypothetical protein